MTRAFATSIVRLFSSEDQKIVGTGFLVSNTHIFTCTQVVTSALNLPQETLDIPIGNIKFDFPLVSPGVMRTAQVLRWQPATQICVLEITSATHETLQPAHIVVAEDVWQHPFYALGFSQKHPNGVEITGEFHYTQDNGWITLQVVKECRTYINESFCGTPIWDGQTKCIVGITIIPTGQSPIKHIFAIPTFALLTAFPELRESILHEFRHYLDRFVQRQSQLPTYFPAHLTIEQIHQPLFISQNPPLLQVEETHIREVDRRLGYFDEGDRIYRWQEPTAYIQPEGIHLIPKKDQHLLLSWQKSRKKRNRWVILGEPGYGKSWLLQMEGYILAEEQLRQLHKDECIPDILCLPLSLSMPDLIKVLQKDKPDIIEAILFMLHEQYSISDSFTIWLRHQLLMPHCYLLLDSFDEVAVEQRPLLVQSLGEFAQLSQCHILLTTLPAYRQDALSATGATSSDHVVELVGFDQKQIETFVQAWFATDEMNGQRVQQMVHRESALHAFAHIPLQLSLLCFIESHAHRAFWNRATIYQEITQLLPFHSIPTDHPEKQSQVRAYSREQNTFLYPGIHAYSKAAYLALLPAKQWIDYVKAHCWFEPYEQEVIVLLAGCLQNPNILLETLLNEANDIFHYLLLLAGRCLANVDKALVKQDVIDRIITQTLALFHSASQKERKQAILVVGQLGVLAVPGLLKLLDTFNLQWEIRGSAIEALGMVGSIVDYEKVLHILQNQQEQRELRCLAAWALGQIGNLQAIEPLLVALQDQSWDVRSAAAEALGHFPDLRSIKPLLTIVQDKNRNLGRYTAPYSFVAQEAVGALQRIGKPVVQEILKTLDNKNKSQVKAIQTLGQLGHTQAIHPLLTILQNKTRNIQDRSLAAWAIGQIGEINEPIIQTASDILLSKDEPYNIRCMATEILGRAGSEQRQGFEALLISTEDRNLDVRRCAIAALGRTGSSRAAEYLARCLHNKSRNVHWITITAMGEIADNRTIKTLIPMLRSGSREARSTAAEALGRIRSPQTIDALLFAVQDIDICPEAIEALGYIGSSTVVDTLMLALHFKNFSAREKAAKALGCIGDIQAIEALLQVAKNNGEFMPVRKASIQALANFGNSDVITALLNLMIDEAFRSETEELEEELRQIRDLPTLEGILSAIRQEAYRPASDALAEALQELGDVRMMNSQLRAYQSENALVRMIISRVMLAEQLADQQELEHFLTLQRETSRKEREHILKALEQATATTLSKLIAVCDPVDCCEQLMQVWSYHHRMSLKVLLYELFLQLAPRLRAAVGDNWPLWHIRLVELSKHLLDTEQ